MSRPMSEPLLVGEGPGATPPAAVAAALAAAGQGARPVLWLDATQGVTLLAEPGAAFADELALAAWARRVWAHYGGDARDTAVAAWRSGGRQGATLTALDLAAWPQAAAVVPLWAGALALALQQLPLVARQGRVLVVEGLALTVIDIADGQIAQWQLCWLAEADAAALAAWVASAPARPVLALGHSLPGTPPASLRVLQPLDAKPADFTAALRVPVAPSFGAAAALAPRWGWALAATAALVLGVAAWDAADAWSQREQAQLALAQAGDAAPRRPVRPPSAANASPADDTARLAAPWAQRFAAAELAAPEGGRWLRLEQARGDTPLRLAGTVPTSQAAYELAQRLAEAPGVADAGVLRSEAVAVAAGAPAHTRFEIAVSWRQERVR